MKRIEALIQKLKDFSYQPKPDRRTYIPKANGKTHPLGIPSFDDKLVQEVVRMILESIYEPTFHVMEPTDLSDEWHMCWECQRCLAGCPTGALSICGKKPEDSLSRDLLPSPLQMEALLTNRRSCRSFKQENVDPELIRHILHVCGNSPTGSCNQVYECTVIDDKEVMREFTSLLRDEMYQQAAKGIYPPRFTKEDLAVFKTCYDKGEEFCFRGAPHMLAVHAPTTRGEWVFDTTIALTYAELAMTCNGLGVIYLTTPWAALQVCFRKTITSAVWWALANRNFNFPGACSARTP